MSNASSKCEGKTSVEEIDGHSPYLEQVIDLGKANSRTLGHFPRGAFEDYASRKSILVALGEGEEFLGYLLYRTSRRKVMIVHLCVREAARGQGVARHLVRDLIGRTQGFLGVGLHCRRDYAASAVWPRLGFSARAEKPGRSKDGSTLTHWWIDHHQRNLFSTAEAEGYEDQLEVAIDANVFYDLEFEADRDSEESLSLVADWLRPLLKLYLTEEIFNEIDRLGPKSERRRKKKAARRYSLLECEAARFQDADASLRSFELLMRRFSEPLSEQDESDIRHLARTIGSGMLFFVTRDETLLEAADDLYEKYGLTVLRPADLVVRLDQLYGEARSQPTRLAGTLIEVKSINQYQEDSWVEHFYRHSTGEKLRAFKRRIRTYTSSPGRYTCNLILSEKQPYAFIAYDNSRDDELRIPFLRLAEGRVAQTIGFHLILQAINQAAQSRKLYVKITDSHLDERLVSALEEDGFIKFERDWTKTVLSIAREKEEVVEVLRHLDGESEAQNSFHRELAELIDTSSRDDARALSYAERQIWPGKIADACIPTFLVSIKPKWAQHLFDERLACQNLFGASRDLALNREGVYYRSRRNSGGLEAPSRVLWYVSADRHFSGSKSVRACARIDEVVIGKPKELYRRYRRLGVYRWQDVIEEADGDVSNDIMAIKFSDVELFEKPVSWDRMQGVLRDEGIKTTLFSPQQITPVAFKRIYELGKDLRSS